MTFETLKRSHLKRNIVIVVAIVLVLSAIILTFTRAKYRTTQSMPLLNGTINYTLADLNIVAMYLNQGGALPEGQAARPRRARIFAAGGTAHPAAVPAPAFSLHRNSFL